MVFGVLVDAQLEDPTRNSTYETEVGLLFFLVDWILNCFGLFDQEDTNISKGKQQCGLVFHLLSCYLLQIVGILLYQF